MKKLGSKSNKSKFDLIREKASLEKSEEPKEVVQKIAEAKVVPKQAVELAAVEPVVEVPAAPQKEDNQQVQELLKNPQFAAFLKSFNDSNAAAAPIEEFLKVREYYIPTQRHQYKRGARNVTIDDDIHEALSRRSQVFGVSIKNIVNYLIEKFMMDTAEEYQRLQRQEVSKEYTPVTPQKYLK
jgi:hypothetical protein